MSSHELAIKTFCDMPNQFFISINHYFPKYDIIKLYIYNKVISKDIFIFSNFISANLLN